VGTDSNVKSVSKLCLNVNVNSHLYCGFYTTCKDRWRIICSDKTLQTSTRFRDLQMCLFFSLVTQALFAKWQ